MNNRRISSIQGELNNTSFKIKIKIGPLATTHVKTITHKFFPTSQTEETTPALSLIRGNKLATWAKAQAKTITHTTPV